MIARFRRILALSLILVALLALAPVQLLAFHAGWPDEGCVRRLWHRITVRALGLSIHRFGRMSEKRPLIIASNHVSWADIPVLGSCMDLCFIAKSELARWPVVGWLARMQRCVFVERQQRQKSGEQASEVAGRLASGLPVVLFAEGSTGDGNRLLPFKSTLFGAASFAIAEGAANSVFIQPLAISYTRIHGLPMGRRHRPLIAWIGDQDLVSSLLALAGEGAVDLELHFGEALEVSAGANRKELARRMEGEVKRLMRDALRDPRPAR